MGLLADGIGDDSGALIYSPGQMKAEAKTANNEILQLAKDVNKSKLSDDAKTAFQSFVSEWQDFYANHSDWTDRLWGAYIEKVADYRKRGLAWRNQLIELGLKPSNPAPDVTPPGVSIPNSDTIKTVAILAGIGVAGLVVWKGFK